jgi:hypothetical protein
MENSAMASSSSNENQTSLFQTDEINLEKYTTAANPPKGRKVREPKLVDDAFVEELKRLNPNKDVEGETQKAKTWVIAHPPRKFTRAFLASWINRVAATKPERFSNF